jgi:hypothetical protein
MYWKRIRGAIAPLILLRPSADRDLLKLQGRVDGLSERRDNYFEAVQQWFARRHRLTIKRKWIQSIEDGHSRYFAAADAHLSQ